jgi:hypothetical protein
VVRAAVVGVFVLAPIDRMVLVTALIHDAARELVTEADRELIKPGERKSPPVLRMTRFERN